MKINKQKFIKGFTLVELIIVITILGILSTIAFISFQGYTKNARDSNRLRTLSNIEKGLDLYKIKTGKYPKPDNIYGTGVINGNLLSYVGEIGENISTQININNHSKDPLSNTNFSYGTTYNLNEYQLSGILESEIYSSNILFVKAYAASEIRARVVGSYKNIIKYNIGNDLYISNVPSLIFSNTGTQNLLNSDTYYVVNKGVNLPYNLYGVKDDSIKIIDGNSIIKRITNNPTSTLTGVNISGLNNNNFSQYFSGETLKSFNLNGIDIDNLHQISETLKIILIGNGNNSSSQYPDPVDQIPDSPYFCTENTPENSVLVVGNPSTEDQPWQYQNSNDSCYYTCDSGYEMNEWGECILDEVCSFGVESITLYNGQEWSCKNLGATTVWDGISQPTNCSGSPTNCNSSLTWIGSYYQWGRNDINHSPGLVGYDYGWEENDSGKWGADIGETINDSGVGGGFPELRQGPCPDGWHIPSGLDWKQMCSEILGIECDNGMIFDSKIINKLKLPFGGSRSYINGNYLDQGQSSSYWSSSPAGESNELGGYFGISSGEIIFSGSERANGYNIRCIRDGEHTY